MACSGAALGACSGADGPKTDPGAGGLSASSGGGEGAGDLGLGGNLPAPDALLIDPPSAEITVVDRATPARQTFVARLDGQTVPATWSLDSYALGDVSTSGEFTSGGLVGGRVRLTATFGASTATAELTVDVRLSEDVLAGPQDPGVSAANRTALGGAPQPDPGSTTTPPNPTKILYPYDNTVMPRGLSAPLLQFSPGSLPPEDVKIALSAPHFSYEGLTHVTDPARPQIQIPQDVWDGALLTAGGQTLRVEVTKAAAGAAYGPTAISILVAPGSLKGAVYYMTYENPVGIYSVRPGVRAPATQIISGCVVCHSVSANGTRLAAGTDAGVAVLGGIYTVGADGMASPLTGPPTGLGGDSRGISFATFTPDGRYVLRSRDDFWGGVNQLAWRVDDATGTLVPATVVGLGSAVSAYVPAISPDGKRYAFTNGAGEPAPFGTVGRSISLMDLDVDPATDTLTFSNRRSLLDNGPSGAVTKFVNFLPDPRLVILQEGENYNRGFGEMLPTWDPNSTYTSSTGRIHMVKVETGEHLELAKLNAGNAEIDRQRNYEPFALPVTAGGYFWVVFTSIREYGNTYMGSDVRKQLWVGAISTNPDPGEDPSHPPFYLPNQLPTRNERGFWALEPCRSTGEGCETGDECCDGFCRPEDPADPRSPKVCNPPQGGCSQDSERCAVDADCCNAPSGSQCIGGFCTPPSPN